MLSRRGFLGAILAAACPPAIVRADALMRIVPRDALLLPGKVYTATAEELAIFEKAAQVGCSGSRLVLTIYTAEQFVELDAARRLECTVPATDYSRARYRQAWR